MPDSVEVYVKRKRLAEANIRGADKDTITRLLTDVMLAMGVKHYRLGTRKTLRTVDEVMDAWAADGKVDVDKKTIPADLLATLEEVGAFAESHA